MIKNWRPISLLSVIYKLASAAISEQLKPVLDNLISPCQSDFVKGRNIGECTRLIYDLIYYTEKNQIPGLLMLIDFEKAFDSVSWNFLYKVLENFGFNKNFINWIKLFYCVNTSCPMDNSLSGRRRPACQTSEKDVLCLHRQVSL